MNIAVIGAGNAGQAIATYAAILGYKVTLYDRSKEKVAKLKALPFLVLEGRIKGKGRMECITDDLSEAVHKADIIMVTVVANAHGEIACRMAHNCEEGQIIILNPGRTFGAMVFRQSLMKAGCGKRVYVAETQTLVYACRIIENGRINVIGVKDVVLLSALPSTDTEYVLQAINPLYPSLKPANNVLHTSLENIGAIFHPSVLLLNAGAIERKNEFYFYRDVTERVAAFIEAVDKERLAVGEAYNLKLNSVSDWIKIAYKDTIGESLIERMRNNPSYHDIKSPTTIVARQLSEDIPTGIVPMMELGKKAGLEMKLFESITCLASALLGKSFYEEGRTLEKLALDNSSYYEILYSFQ